MSRLEQSDLVSLRDTEFEKLRVALRFPAEFFLERPLSMVSSADLAFRAQKGTSSREKEYLAAFAELAGDFIESLDSRYGLPPLRLPIVRTHETNSEPTSMAEYAGRLVREAVSLDADTPIHHLTHRVERYLGVPVVVQAGRLRREHGFSGEPPTDSSRVRHTAYSARTGEFGERPIVVTRAEQSWERMRFSVAHEIGHLVMHADVARGRMADQLEEEANAFACELIAPISTLRRSLRGDITLHDLVALKRRWGLSIGALIKHLARGGAYSAQRERALQKQLHARINPVTGKSWGRTEPGFDDHQPERPRMLLRWTERVFSTTDTRAIASQQRIWPRDILDEFLAEQRSSSFAARGKTSDVNADSGGALSLAPVVDFDEARKRKQSG
ncbi:ImmA/IrrE family metallo-endopeptidase [Epidermidibacterium keratini]|uniref:ImmA/IrrE family metallo-endopeptidase n=1 Tax=Epidermidibacterium keratini TaxID=1891644 RepID=A0A7L4YKC3_9ACTN|nr:ImmA/IrrE family metallo-endopeptidase [Epidermidibacterium keratini]QHB99507.1 ImmA/IrrE family metallo-endopeptidase [Epidermidibacterium keratini]